MTDLAHVVKIAIHGDSGQGYYAHSADIPGLHVCGESLELTCGRIVKAIKAIFKHSRGMDVDVRPATLGLDDGAPQEKCDHFVVQRLAA